MIRLLSNAFSSFISKLRLCIAALQATPAQGLTRISMVARIQRLSLWESSRRSRVRGGVIATICPLRRLRRHRLAAARSRSGSDTTPWCHSFPSRRFATQRARLFVSLIITQIDRENNVSADFYVCIQDRRGRRSLQVVDFLTEYPSHRKAWSEGEAFRLLHYTTNRQRKQCLCRFLCVYSGPSGTPVPTGCRLPY